MSAVRLGKNWADVDEEDEDDVVADGASKFKSRCFETAADEHGIKTVVEYKERDGKTYKVTKRVKQIVNTKWSNPEMTARKTMPKFGKVKNETYGAPDMHVQKSMDDVAIELCKKAIKTSEANDAEDKFYEEALKNIEGLFKEKKVWTDVNRDKLDAGAAAQAPLSAVADALKPAGDAGFPPPKAGGPAKYVPPSVARAAAGGKGDGKGKDGKGGDEASLRVVNLSEDVREGDLQDLFGQFGRLQRVYLAKDMETFVSKGFAFVTFYTKEDAQKAINKLNGHGYDNLIMQVMWAKPKA